MTWLRVFSCTWRRLHIFASNSDWFIALFGQSNYFWFWFYDTQMKTALFVNFCNVQLQCGLSFIYSLSSPVQTYVFFIYRVYFTFKKQTNKQTNAYAGITNYPFLLESL